MSGFLDFLTALGVPTIEDALKIGVVYSLTGRPNNAGSPSFAPETSAYFTDNGQIIYPQDLFSPGNNAYIAFIMREPTFSSPKICKRIALYMPPSINVKYQSQWEPISLGAFKSTEAGENILQSLRTGNVDLNTLKNVPNALAGFSAYNVAKFADAGTIAANVPAFAAAGVAVNPHAALAFKGIDFRTFEFSFELFARNSNESEAIRKIIKTFKWAMHPDAKTVSLPGTNVSNNKIFWDYPHVFDIYLATPSEQYMFNITRSVLEDMDVNYTGSNRATFFRYTGAPVHVTLTLRFKEMEILTKERVVENY